MKFNTKKESENIINFIRTYYKKNNIKGAVIGISGGKDSAVVSAIMSKAIGSENIIGITMPCYSDEKDRKDGKIISDFYKFKLINHDLTNTFDTFKKEVKKNEIIKGVNSDINLKPRLRMSTLYYYAALYTEKIGGIYLVIGTSNKSEIHVGYFTKGGDNICDIAPIADFTVEEVVKIGKYLKVPKEVLYKTPSDGLSGKSDEENLGIKYSDISKVINKEKLDKKVKEKIDKLHKNSLHKFNIPIYKKKNI